MEQLNSHAVLSKSLMGNDNLGEICRRLLWYDNIKMDIRKPGKGFVIRLYDYGNIILDSIREELFNYLSNYELFKEVQGRQHIMRLPS